MRRINTNPSGYEELRTNHDFYVDKTSFIKEWWEDADTVMMFMRPHGTGKTLNMDMLNCFFSNRYAGRSDLFEGMDIWKEEKYRELQGTYPVIVLSFADIKETTFQDARRGIARALQKSFYIYKDLWDQLDQSEKEKYFFYTITEDSPDAEVIKSLQQFSYFLASHYQKKVLILLDAYDVPLLAAYENGYWKEMDSFIRCFCTSVFKVNRYLERGLLTGVTRIPKEPYDSGFNNVSMKTIFYYRYETCFGFTQEEVNKALEEYHLSDQKEIVKEWYGGFNFQSKETVYNPASIVQYLAHKGKTDLYSTGIPENNLISKQLRISPFSMKSQMENLLNDGTVEMEIDEEFYYSQIDNGYDSLWNLLLAEGYFNVISHRFDGLRYHYVLRITDLEVKQTLQKLITEWFRPVETDFRAFMRSLICGDCKSLRESLKNIQSSTDNFYDDRRYISEAEKPESFCYGLLLGMVAQEKEYRITSNRESGRGRYDVMMKPLKKDLPGIIIEFKVFDPKRENDLEETADRALSQIREKNYDAELIAENIPEENILHYGMAFSGKDVVVKTE